MFKPNIGQLSQRKQSNFIKSTSKNKIIIQKSKLPPNFFKPLTISTDGKDTIDYQNEEMHTPCFGMHTQHCYESLENSRRQFDKKEEFYSWFSKGLKPLTTRVQTVPVQSESLCDLKKNMTERKRKNERVKSVQQEKSSRSQSKIMKKYQKIVSNKISLESSGQPHFFKLKATNIGEIQKNFKNHFKVNPAMKRGVAQSKYRQYKALDSLSSAKPTNFLPSISHAL